MNTEVDAGKRVPAADDASDNRRRFYPFKKPKKGICWCRLRLQPCYSHATAMPQQAVRCLREAFIAFGPSMMRWRLCWFLCVQSAFCWTLCLSEDQAHQDA